MAFCALIFFIRFKTSIFSKQSLLLKDKLFFIVEESLIIIILKFLSLFFKIL